MNESIKLTNQPTAQDGPDEHRIKFVEAPTKIMSEQEKECDIFVKCMKFILNSNGFPIIETNLNRALVVTFGLGNYDRASTVLIEVSGSPVLGRVIVFLKGSACSREVIQVGVNSPIMMVETPALRLVKVRRDSLMISNLAELVLRAHKEGKTRVVMAKICDKVHFLENVGDSLVLAENCMCGKCDSENNKVGKI
jgi:hypothetical protein